MFKERYCNICLKKKEKNLVVDYSDVATDNTDPLDCDCSKALLQDMYNAIKGFGTCKQCIGKPFGNQVTQKDIATLDAQECRYMCRIHDVRLRNYNHSNYVKKLKSILNWAYVDVVGIS